MLKQRLFIFIIWLVILQSGIVCKAEVAKDTTTKEDNKTVYIQDIFFIGNKKTKKQIIQRELQFQEGDWFLMSELKKIALQDEDKIFNTGLFNKAEIRILEHDQNKVTALVSVTERWYSFPIPIFKLVDRNFNDWWTNRNKDFSRVNYGLKFLHFNFRGRKEELKLVAQFGFTRNFEVLYNIPYIDNAQKFGLGLSASFSERKNLAFRTENHLDTFIDELDDGRILRQRFGLGMTLSHRNSFYNRHYFSVNFRNSIIDDTIRSLNPRYFNDNATQQLYLRLAYEFVRDVRDSRSYPLSGYRIILTASKLGLGIFNDIDIWRLRLRYSKYFDLGKGYYLASSVRGLMSNPANQPYFNFSSLGSDQTLVRGYETSLIEGPRYGLIKSSFRKKLIEGEHSIKKVMPFEQFQTVPYGLYAKIFFDGGYVNNYPNYENNDRLTDRFLYGIGVGLDFISFYDFVVRTEYSYNAEGNFTFFLNFKKDIN